MSRDDLMDVSLDPDPVIEAYKKDVDRTLIRESVKKMQAALELVEEIRRTNRSGR